MQKMGLEPTRYCYHKILSLARLPIPTLPLKQYIMRKMGLEPTRHGCHKILSLARLPIPTLPHFICSMIFTGLLRADHE